MADKLKKFERAAEQAAKAGEAERRALATTLVADLNSDPAHFDPKRLVTLGRVGLEVFAAEVAAQKPPPTAPPQEDEQPVMKGADVQGWAKMRKKEIGFVMHAVAGGVASCGVVIAIALLKRMVSN